METNVATSCKSIKTDLKKLCKKKRKKFKNDPPNIEKKVQKKFIKKKQLSTRARARKKITGILRENYGKIKYYHRLKCINAIGAKKFYGTYVI